MAQRAQYWSCTKFADWLRGTPKPEAATSSGWNDWRKSAKVKKVRYWLAEEGLDAIQDFIWWPVDKLYGAKYYINNRWVTRTHALTASPAHIKRGTWRDMGDRILPCLFDEFTEFVEVELAWNNVAWSKEAREKYRAPFYAWGWFRWRTWRCPEAALDYLEWASKLTNEEWLDDDKKHLAEPTYQALAAREMILLYKWWKEEYPKRGDSHDLSGWTELCERRRQKAKQEDPDSDSWGLLDPEKETEEEREETRRILDLTNKIEAEQKQEDTDMLIRLIKIRDSFWT